MWTGGLHHPSGLPHLPFPPPCERAPNFISRSKIVLPLIQLELKLTIFLKIIIRFLEQSTIRGRDGIELNTPL